MAEVDINAVVKKLIGEIQPVGETLTDSERFENLQGMCKLVEELVTEINHVVDTNWNAQESSRKKAADYARTFLTDLKKENHV